MLAKTKQAMEDFAKTLTYSTARAQCYNIANLDTDGRTIAKALRKDHYHKSDAKRAAILMVKAGCAKEKDASKYLYGTFIFEDGSEL